ncbi:MAG: rhodanese-like domain-containing protein [Caulobacterales bacterium]
MSNFPLCLPETLMEDAREMADAQGVSINQFLSTLIAERIGELKALRHVRQRIGRASSAGAAAVLALVPDRAPLEGDEMPGDRVFLRRSGLLGAGAACWESYNAVLRAQAAGFTRVYWYRGGLRSWEEAQLPLQSVPQPAN